MPRKCAFAECFSFFFNAFMFSPCLFLFSSFYTINEVHKFQYSRPVRKGEKDPDNEFSVII